MEARRQFPGEAATVQSHKERTVEVSGRCVNHFDLLFSLNAELSKRYLSAILAD